MSLSSYVIQDREKIDLNDIRLSVQNREHLEQLLKENLYTEKLQKYNLPVNNKLMLHGPSGCGKKFIYIRFKYHCFF